MYRFRSFSFSGRIFWVMNLKVILGRPRPLCWLPLSAFLALQEFFILLLLPPGLEVGLQGVVGTGESTWKWHSEFGDFSPSAYRDFQACVSSVFKLSCGHSFYVELFSPSCFFLLLEKIQGVKLLYCLQLLSSGGKNFNFNKTIPSPFCLFLVN